MRRVAGYVFWFLLIGGTIATVLIKSEDAREVAGEAVWDLFRFFTTPFILELSVAIMGLLAVTTYNQWRRSKDGPEWVEMEVPDKTEKEPPSPPTT
jgi:hypothetical protein